MPFQLLMGTILAAALGLFFETGSMPPIAQASEAPALTIHIKQFVFTPKEATIVQGQAVTFVNDDDAPHTVTADDKSYDSGDMPKSASWTHTFATPGTVTFNCAYHAFMHGSLTVKAKT